jgi:hypothetical protein
MTTHYHQVITKILVGAAIVLGACVWRPPLAGADPNPIGTDPNPFSALTSQKTAPPGSPVLSQELHRGILAGLSA